LRQKQKRRKEGAPNPCTIHENALTGSERGGVADELVQESQFHAPADEQLRSFAGTDDGHQLSGDQQSERGQ
jgi:hypothetical protein